MTWLERLDYVPEVTFSVNDILTRLRRQEDTDLLVQAWADPEVPTIEDWVEACEEWE